MRESRKGVERARTTHREGEGDERGSWKNGRKVGGEGWWSATSRVGDGNGQFPLDVVRDRRGRRCGRFDQKLAVDGSN